MSEQLTKTINCKHCHNDFKYNYTFGDKSGFQGMSTKRYCDECAKIKKQISNRESQRTYVKRGSVKKVSESITKKSVTRNAIKFVLDLNKYLKVTNTSSEVYDKVMDMLPDGYISRDVLRKFYREVTLRNEI